MIALNADDVRRRELSVGFAASRLDTSLRLISEKAGELKEVETFRLPLGKTISPDVRFSYNPGRSYVPNMARYDGTLAPLVHQQLGGYP